MIEMYERSPRAISWQAVGDLATTCLVKHANTCHCLLVSTCLLSLPVNGLPSKKERLCMSRSDSQNHPTPSSSHTTSRKRRSPDVTEARAHAQRAKLETQIQQRQSKEEDIRPTKKPKGEKTQENLQAKRRAMTTIARAIDDYLQDHEGGNHSKKTLEWHQTALGFFSLFLQEERAITLVGEVDAPDISTWFAYLRKTPGRRGKLRSERTIQT